MKVTLILAALAGAAILTGCDTPTPTLLSLEPVTTDKEAISLDGLQGTWESNDETVLIHRKKDASNQNQYDVVYLSSSAPIAFDAKVFRSGDALLMDVTPSDDNDFRIPGHAIARIWLDSTGFRWAFLDSDWFKQQVAGSLITYKTNNRTLLLAQGTSVRALIDKFGTDSKACGKVTTWQKL